MNYTPKQRAQIAESFRYALKEIASGRQEYICHVLEWRFKRGPGDVPALRIIQHRMGAYRNGLVLRPGGGHMPVRGYGLDGWLLDHGVVRKRPHPITMRKYRIRWLDALIKEFTDEPA